MWRTSLRLTLTCCALAGAATAQLAPGPDLAPGAGRATGLAPGAGPQLYLTTADDFLSGAVVGLADSHAPALEVLAATAGAQHLRRFGRQLFVVDRGADTVQRVSLDGGPPQLYQLESGAAPMDVLVDGPPMAAGAAWLSLRSDPALKALDLSTGATTDLVDLSPVGGGSPVVPGMMIRHGDRLFVQVRVVDDQRLEAPSGDHGALAVVDLPSGQLLDVDRVSAGVQGVALMGAPPRFKMQIVGQTLFVSTTDSTNDVRGGIERVDLGTLASTGYAVSEATGHSDMGGFVMLDESRGYYVFHTDLLSSTHLVGFHVGQGPTTEGMIDLLGDTVDVLVHDPWRRRLYLPSGYATASTGDGPGLYSFNTRTNTFDGPPLNTGARPHDVLLVLPILSGPAP